MTGFSGDWLALRAPADRVARSADLARRFAAALPRPCRVLDLGAGTGSNVRAVAPLIGGAQDWLLVELDPGLIAAQEAAFRRWAGPDHAVTREEDGAISVATPHGPWRIAARRLDLAADIARLDGETVHGVASAALLDLMSAGFLDDLAAWLVRRRLPFLAALDVDGRRLWSPAAPGDDTVAAGFRHDQARDKGFGAALGGEASAYLARRLERAGWRVASARSDWRLDAASSGLLEALVGGEAAAARAGSPRESAAIAAWERRRRDDLAAGRLAITVGHSDMLALPPEI